MLCATKSEGERARCFIYAYSKQLQKYPATIVNSNPNPLKNESENKGGYGYSMRCKELHVAGYSEV